MIHSTFGFGLINFNNLIVFERTNVLVDVYRLPKTKTSLDLIRELHAYDDCFTLVSTFILT